MNVSPLRTDAAQRRRQILDAADEVFSECGVNVPLELVVERSGVGRATLYRNFPDRIALVTALFERGLDALERLVADIGDRADGLAIVLEDLADHVACSAAMADLWRAMPRSHPFVAHADRRVLEILMPLVRRAAGTGLCRPGIDEEQVLLVLDMLGSCLRGQDEAERRRLARRCAALVQQALGFAPAAPRPAA